MQKIFETELFELTFITKSWVNQSNACAWAVNDLCR